MKRIIFVSFLALNFFIASFSFAQEASFDEDFDRENKIVTDVKNIAGASYRSSITFDSGFIPVNYHQTLNFDHGLNVLPLKVDVIFKDSQGRITGWNAGLKNGHAWRGIKWDATYCDTTSCTIQLSGHLGTAGIGEYNEIRVLVWAPF